jgi:pyruvate dehydrogenase E2 component (dihydrolipoamide acetyltransferase)
MGHPFAQSASDRRVFASPLARRLAAHEAVDLMGIEGTGPHGRILARDVSARARTPLAPTGLAARQAMPPDRRQAAIVPDAMPAVAHGHLTSHCDIDALLTLCAALNSKRSEAERLSIDDFMLRAAAVALVRVPDCNVVWSGDVLTRLSHADIAMTVATDGDLVAAVITDAGAKPLSAIASAAKTLAAEARGPGLAHEPGLADEQCRGGALMVRHLGAFGVSHAMWPVDPPRTAILAIGAAEERLRLVCGQAMAATTVTVTLSVDHRAIGSVTAAQWLQEFKALVETPLTMLV